MVKVYPAEVGLEIEITIVGLTTLAGSTVTYLIRKPNGVLVSKTATIDNPTTGVTHWTTTATTDLDIAGNYCIQPRVVIGGNTYYAEDVALEVDNYYE